ncbi:WGR domain-containing protein [Rhizobium paknamense]|uniref:DNA-binding WGR domain protein n=1 Tax=Rhizobium paknamense TaxID=1206817 RepID=A0ABU0IIX7_9HYPH|nr:putative DNA-binding WGR domain protein [Rhizobium paknamense]
MARFYALEISQTLFGDACLTRRWGRIGHSGKSLSHHFERADEALRLFHTLARRKTGRGYCIRS